MSLGHLWHLNLLACTPLKEVAFDPFASEPDYCSNM